MESINKIDGNEYNMISEHTGVPVTFSATIAIVIKSNVFIHKQL